MSFLLLFLVILFVVAGGIALTSWSAARDETHATQMLDKWLRKNNFQLLQKSALLIKDSPFLTSYNHSQKVFKVTIITSDGTTRAAWVRCGHALVGMAKDQIEVKWEDLTPQN